MPSATNNKHFPDNFIMWQLVLTFDSGHHQATTQECDRPYTETENHMLEISSFYINNVCKIYTGKIDYKKGQRTFKSNYIQGYSK